MNNTYKFAASRYIHPIKNSILKCMINMLLNQHFSASILNYLNKETRLNRE